MTRLVLDTSAYSHFRRGEDAVVSLVTAASWVGMTATVLGELITRVDAHILRS